MEIGRLNAVLTIGVIACVYASIVEICEGNRAPEKFIVGGQNFAPLEDGLLKFTPVASGPVAMAPDHRFPLILAAKRTRRPDVLNKLRIYVGGWDITNKHYWASVGFTGAAGFILAILWFVSFGIALGSLHCCRWRIGIKEVEGSNHTQHICLMLLLVFTCAASTGCILLSVGQDDFHDEVLDTLSFVVNQSDFTVQILRNVTDFLSYAKTISVEEVYLPSNVQKQIDKLNVDLNSAANTLSEKTNESSGKIRKVIDNVCALIVVAGVMLVLAILGFLLSILRHKHAMYIFIMSGWLLVAVTFALCGGFVILNNAVGDTCTAMDQWVLYPHAETALSNILPCVDERTANQTLYQSKDVIRQLVNIVNTAIWTVANSNSPPQYANSYSYNQSGPLMPTLCSPYDSQLHSRQCDPYEVSFDNASMVWQNYTCAVSESGSCISPGRITPDIYDQLVAAVNVSYALDHYAPLLLNLQDCAFVRQTFNSITTYYCPDLQQGLKMVNIGLALISIGVMLCLILWIVYANRPRREEVFVTTLSEVKVSPEKR